MTALVLLAAWSPSVSVLLIVDTLVLRRETGVRETRRTGVVASVVGGAVAVAVWRLGASAVVAVLGVSWAWAMRRWWRRRRERQERAFVLESSLVDVAELFVIAASAGLTVHQAVRAVAPRAPPVLRPSLIELVDRVEHGARLADALAEWPARLGVATPRILARSTGTERANALVQALLATERHGAPLVPSLQRVADDLHRDRRARAETAARRLPVLLLFPLVFGVLPSFALLTLVPLMAGAVGSLRR